MANNPFDQFDAPASAAAGSGNPFDQFDGGASKPAEAPSFTGSFSRGLKRTIPETKSLLAGAGAAVAGAVGADDVRDSLLSTYQDIQTNQVEPLANKSGFIDAVTGNGSLRDWAGDTLGNFAGQALQSVAAGAVGATLGSVVPGAGTVAGGIGGLVAKAGAKDMVEGAVARMVAKGVADGVARKQVLAQLGGAAAATTGLNVGQEVGIGFTGRAEDAKAAGQDLTQQDALRAIGWGVPAGLVDTAAEALTGKLVGEGISSAPRMLTRVAKGAGVGAVTEGGTEGVQAVMERAGAGQEMTGEQAYKDYIENVAAGALGGAVPGAAGGLRRQQPNTPPGAPPVQAPAAKAPDSGIPDPSIATQPGPLVRAAQTLATPPGAAEPAPAPVSTPAAPVEPTAVDGAPVAPATASTPAPAASPGEPLPVFDRALQLLAAAGKVSAGGLGKQLKLSKDQTVALMDELQARGIVSGKDSRGQRRLLTNPATGEIIDPKAAEAATKRADAKAAEQKLVEFVRTNDPSVMGSPPAAPAAAPQADPAAFQAKMEERRTAALTRAQRPDPAAGALSAAAASAFDTGAADLVQQQRVQSEQKQAEQQAIAESDRAAKEAARAQKEQITRQQQMVKQQQLDAATPDEADIRAVLASEMEQRGRVNVLKIARQMGVKPRVVEALRVEMAQARKRGEPMIPEAPVIDAEFTDVTEQPQQRALPAPDQRPAQMRAVQQADAQTSRLKAEMASSSQGLAASSVPGTAARLSDRQTQATSVPTPSARSDGQVAAPESQAPSGDSAYDTSADVLDSDITPPSGGAFSLRGAAEQAAKSTPGGKVFEVDGGFVVRTPRSVVAQAATTSPDPGLEDALRQERDAYTNERYDAYLNKTKHARDPVKDAIEDALNAGVLDPDAARVVLDVALSNGRVDLAEYAVSRAERAVAGMSVTPGVPQNSPKYADIKAALESRKREATALLDSLKKDLAAAKTATVRESLTVGTVAAENEQQERERADNEQQVAMPELSAHLESGQLPTINSEMADGKTVWTATAVKSTDKKHYLRLDPTKEERKAATVAESDIALADTQEEREAAKLALRQALLPATKRAVERAKAARAALTQAQPAAQETTNAKQEAPRTEQAAAAGQAAAEAKPEALLSEKPAAGLSTAALEAFLKPAAEALRKDGVQIHVITTAQLGESTGDAAEDARREAMKRGMGNKKSRASVSGDRQHVYFFADKLKTIEEAARVAAHELVGHIGMERLLGGRWAELRAAVLRLRDAGKWPELFDEVRARYASNPDGTARGMDDDTFAAEAIAVFAERNVKTNILQAAMVAARGWLRRTFPNQEIEISQDELRQLVWEAGRMVKGKRFRSGVVEDVLGSTEPAAGSDVNPEDLARALKAAKVEPAAEPAKPSGTMARQRMPRADAVAEVQRQLKVTKQRATEIVNEIRSEAKNLDGVTYNLKPGIVQTADVQAAIERERAAQAKQAPAAIATHKDPGQPAEPVTAPVIADAIKTSAAKTPLNLKEARAWLLERVDEALKGAPKSGANVTVSDPRTEEGRKVRYVSTDVVDPVSGASRPRLRVVEIKVADSGSTYNIMHGNKVLDRQDGSLRFAILTAENLLLASKWQPTGGPAGSWDFTGSAPADFVTFDVPGDGKFKVLNTRENLEAFRAKVVASSGFKDERKRTAAAPMAKSEAWTVINSFLEDAEFGNAYTYSNAVDKPLRYALGKRPDGAAEDAVQAYAVAEDVEISGFKMWVGRLVALDGAGTGIWTVVEPTTGRVLGSAGSRDAAIGAARALAKKHGDKWVADKIKSEASNRTEAQREQDWLKANAPDVYALVNGEEEQEAAPAAKPQQQAAQPAPTQPQDENAKPAKANDVDARYEHLLSLKSTRLMDKHSDGRALYEVTLSMEQRKALQDSRGQFNRSVSFELKTKEEVTGNKYATGYVLIDRREQNANRAALEAKARPVDKKAITAEDVASAVSAANYNHKGISFSVAAKHAEQVSAKLKKAGVPGWAVDMAIQAGKDQAARLRPGDAAKVAAAPIIESLRKNGFIKAEPVQTTSPTLAEAKKNEPLTEWALQGFIKIAADSVQTLRPVDVERVIRETPAQHRQAVAEYIKKNSYGALDLEVDDVARELGVTMTPVAPDLKGFKLEQTDSAAFDLVDGNMRVSVVPMADGKFQASYRGAKSSPHLQSKQAAIDWAAGYRDEAKRLAAPASSVQGQKNMAARGGRIATLMAMNGRLRKLDPDSAWLDSNIEQADDLDALQDQISEALTKAERGKQPTSALRSELEQMSGAELRAVFDRMSLAGARMAHIERVEALMAEDEAAVRAAMAAVQPEATTGPADAKGERKFYVTMIRDSKVARIAGPFDTKEEADAILPAARDKAKEVDPRAVFDAFGVSAVTMEEHKSAALNEQLGIGKAAPSSKPAAADNLPTKFISIYNGASDYSVYIRRIGKDVRVGLDKDGNFKNIQAEITDDEKASAIASVNRFIREDAVEQVKYLESRGLDVPAELRAKADAKPAAKEYRYAMVNRPVGIGTAPKGVLRVDPRPASGAPHHDEARHGIAVYDRKLTDEETKQFEMAPLAEGADLEAVAKRVADGLRDYADGYIEMAANENAEFVRGVAQRLKRASDGYTPSVGDAKQFANLVLEQLKAGSTEAKPAAAPTIPEGYKPTGEPYYVGKDLVQGYAKFPQGERVKLASGIQGVVTGHIGKGPILTRAMVKFDNGTESGVDERELVAVAPAEQDDEAPTMTRPEARELMFWQDMGQKDGEKSHRLTFYTSKDDAESKRGSMTYGKITKDQGSSKWFVEDGDSFTSLADAKRQATEMALDRAEREGFIAKDAPAKQEAQAKATATPPQAADFPDAASYHAAVAAYRAANPATPAAPKQDRRAEIKRELAALQQSYEKRMNRADGAVPPAIKADALAGIARKMDKLTAELKALDEAKATPAKPGAITDFGEKLPPARRAMAAKLDEALTDADIANRPLSEIWPLAENDAIEDTFAAAVAHAARAEIPAKPRKGYKVTQWVAKVKIMRDLAASLVSGRTDRDTFISAANRRSATLAGSLVGYDLRDWISKVLLLEQIDRSQWKRISDVESRPDMKTKVGDAWVTVPQLRIVIDDKPHYLTGDNGATESATVEGNLAGILGLMAKDAQSKALRFEIRGSGGRFYIAKKDDPEIRQLMTFTSVEDARKAITEQYDSLVAAWQAIKDRDNITERDLRGEENRPRVGKDHRKGRDVKPEDFQEKFGFKGGEFGKWVQQGKGDKDRQTFLNNAYDSLMDLAELAGIAPRAISLNGTLGIAFGSRGSGWASAHFEPSNLVINLTKTRGAGALAHEWFHALDNYFSRLRGGEIPFTGSNNQYRSDNYITHNPEPLMVRKDGSMRYAPMTRGKLEATHAARKHLTDAYNPDNWKVDPKHREGVRPEVEARFADLVQALNDSPMTKRSAKLDKGKSNYWSSTLERAARAFEIHVIARLAEQGNHNDFLANVNQFDEMAGKGEDRYPYLLPGEVKPIADAFDALFNTVQTRTEPSGSVAMFAKSGEPQQFSPATARAWQALAEIPGTFQRPRTDAKSFEDITKAILPDAEVVEVDDGATITVQPMKDDKGNVARDMGTTLVRVEYVRTSGGVGIAPTDIGRGTLVGYTKDGKEAFSTPVNGRADVVTEFGQEVADRLLAQSGNAGRSAGLNTHVRTLTGVKVNPLGKPKAVTMTILDGELAMDASQLQEGVHRGSALYSIALAYAHNNGVVFIPDPADVSEAAMQRRGEHMLSSALKYGTTRHMVPDPEQGLDWRDGDDQHNVLELVRASADNVADNVPDLQAIDYDWDSGQFVGASGKPFTLDDFKALAESPAGRAARAGVSTLRRGVVSRSLERRAGTPAWRGVVTRLLQLGRAGLLGSQLEGILYARGADGARGMPTDKLTRLLATAKQAMALLGVNIEVVANGSDLPAEITGQDDYDDTVQAAITGDRKTVYFVASRIKSPRDAIKLVAHELVGHMSMEQLLGKRWPELRDAILRLRDNGKWPEVFAEVSKRYERNADGTFRALDDATFAAEAIAVFAERNIQTSILQRAVNGVRAWLRRLGFAMDMSQGELRQMLWEAGQKLEGRAYRAAVVDDVLGAKPEPKQMSMREAVERYSFGKGGAETIDVDGVERPTTDSTGKPIHPTEEGLRNFWRWFRNGAANRDGKPTPYIHSSSNAVAPIASADSKFGGVFAVESKAVPYGDFDHAYFVRGRIADTRDLRDAADAAQKVAARLFGIRGRAAEVAAESALSEADPPPEFSRIVRATDEADAYTEMQRLRGEIARDLGFSAVWMHDETGRSLLMLSGDDAKTARQANGEAEHKEQKAERTIYKPPKVDEAARAESLRRFADKEKAESDARKAAADARNAARALKDAKDDLAAAVDALYSKYGAVTAEDYMAETPEGRAEYRINPDVADRVARAESALRKLEATKPTDARVNFAKAGTIVDRLQEAINPKNTTLLQRIKSKLSDWRPAALGALQLRHLGELAEDILPPVATYSQVVQRMATMRNELQELGHDVVDAGMAYQGANPEEAKKLFRMLHDATLAGVDPAEAHKRLQMMDAHYRENVDVTPENVRAFLQTMKGQAKLNPGSAVVYINRAKEARKLLNQERRRAQSHREMFPKFARLSPDAKKLWVQMRDAYRTQSAEYEKALISRIQSLDFDKAQKAGQIARMRLMFESARVPFYVPLARWGEYWVSGTNAEGQREFYMQESAQAQQRVRKELADQGYKEIAHGVKLDTVRAQDGASASFMGELDEMLKKSGATDKIRDEAFQLYLRSLPDLSIRQNFIHRQGTPGYSQDALRALAGHIFHGSFQIARLRYSHELEAIRTEAESMAKDMSKADDPAANAAGNIVNELKKRHEWVMNPQDNPVVNKISSVGFVYYLGLTPAAALVNLLQTPMVALPVLAGKHKVGDVTRELWRAMKQSLGTYGHMQKQLEGEELEAHTEFGKRGVFDKTQSANLAGISESDTHAYSPRWHKTMSVISHLFHKGEIFNREATAMAAYRLERAAGAGHLEAIEAADRAVHESHFDYSNANRARYMQSGAAKVLLMFRQYSLAVTWLLGRNLWQSMKGMDAQTRTEARRKLAGVLGMTAIFSGTLGLPLLGTVGGVMNALAAAFGDDDEPWDWETEFRAFMRDMLGDTGAEAVLNGPVQALTGVGIASRVSMGDLWFREPDRELEGRAWSNYLFEQAAGPMGGLITNFFRGQQLMSEGQVWRGVETIMPKAIKDAMKSVRYLDEGVNNLRGDAIVADLNVFESLAQIAGFSPASVSDAYDTARDIKNYEQAILSRRSRLMDAFALAWRLGDTDAREEILVKMRKFSQTYPELAITGDSIKRSLTARARASAQADGGVIVDKRIRARLEAQLG